MKTLRNLLYLLLPLQIIVQLLSPRFDWTIHNFDTTPLAYQGMSYRDGAFHSLYESSVDTVDISYENLFSKKFTITVNDNDTYTMEVKIDGASVESEPDMLPGIANDMVWQDTQGILYWRCILTVFMSLVSIKVFNRANDMGEEKRKVFYVGAAVLYVISMLISLRILF